MAVLLGEYVYYSAAQQLILYLGIIKGQINFVKVNKVLYKRYLGFLQILLKCGTYNKKKESEV